MPRRDDDKEVQVTKTEAVLVTKDERATVDTPVSGTYTLSGEGITVSGTLSGTAQTQSAPPPSGGTSTAAPAWEWRMVYYWTQGYSQALPNQYGNDVPYGRGINLQKGAKYPAGYRVSDGHTPGGVYPASGAVASGNEPIKMQPPPKGTGAIKFWTTCQIWIKNTDSARTGNFVFGLGVSDVNGPDFPMHPYIGVGHYLEMNQNPAVTVRPGDTVAYSLSRLDIVDTTFHEVPNWPNWEMVPNSGNKLWPAVTPLFQNRGPVDLVAVGFWGISYATL